MGRLNPQQSALHSIFAFLRKGICGGALEESPGGLTISVPAKGADTEIGPPSDSFSGASANTFPQGLVLFFFMRLSPFLVASVELITLPLCNFCVGFYHSPQKFFHIQKNPTK